MAHSETHSQKVTPMPKTQFKAMLDSLVEEMKDSPAWENNITDEFEQNRTATRIYNI